jgi:lauroyl/myristoyl acyltransferase
MMIAIAEAVRSSLPLSALEVATENLVRYPEAGRVEFTLVVKAKNIVWQAADDGKSILNLTLAAASLDEGAKILTSKMEAVIVTADSQDAGRLAGTPTKIRVRLRVPAGTQNIRVVVQAAQEGGFGAVDLSSAVLAAAPLAPTPEPGLIPRP